MIVDEGGKFRTERTIEEEVALLQQDLKALTPEERETLQLIVREMTGQHLPQDNEEQPTIMGALGNAEYKTKPVDIETFVRDPYFLGNSCDNIYPVLLEDLKKIFSGGYEAVVLTGAIGVGKTFVASIGICRILYEISCMRDPHRSFGIQAGTNIAIVALSVSEALAIKVAFDYIVTKIEKSPYFMEHFPFKKTKKEIKFPKNVWVAPRASSDNSALGLNVIAAIMDETNFLPKPVRSVRNMPGQPRFDAAENLYNQIKLRMKSRFERNGKLPGVMFLSSSKQTVDDFTEKKIREAKNDPKIYVSDYALWEVKPENYEHVGRFHVLVGNELSPSKILEPEEVEEVRATLPEGAVVVEVPDSFRTDFERDLEKSIRDVAGRATAALCPFIARREKILEAVDRGAELGHKHPFSSEVFDMSKKSVFLWDRMVRPQPERKRGGEIVQVLRPIVNPTAVRHIHIDTSLRGDCTGFCVAHVCGHKDVVRKNEEGQEYVVRAPVYFIDLVLQIVPPSGDEIILGEVRRLVYDLSSRGYIITSVTTDAYQSADTIQQLNRKGYTAELLSVDTSPEPYDNLKTALYEARVIMYEYAPLIGELRSLERNVARNKVDHPPGGSKDCSDAMAGACFSLSQKNQHMPLPIIPTSGLSPSFLIQPSGDPSVPDLSQPREAGSRLALPPFLSGAIGDDWGGGWNPPFL